MTPARQRVLTIILIVIGVLVVGFFGLRTLHAFREFRVHRPRPPFAPVEARPAETDVELIRDWMTIPYIGRMYQVPPPMLFDALDIPGIGNGEKSLLQLNDEFFPTQDGIVLEKVKAAVSANQPQVMPTVPTASSMP